MIFTPQIYFSVIINTFALLWQVSCAIEREQMAHMADAMHSGVKGNPTLAASISTGGRVPPDQPL
jgi:hypothetical protein